ncbi:unnamed protein product, partial [Polarella glacialis]
MAGRRRSLAPSKATAAASAPNRRHSLPSYRAAPEAGNLPDEVGAGGGALLALLAHLPRLEGSVDFGTSWQRMRRVSPAQICLDLLAAGRLVEALDIVFARHSGSFSPEEVLDVVEAVPLDIGEADEARLPLWLLQQAIPLLRDTSRPRLARWVAARAELLEAKYQEPGPALRLLGTVVAAASVAAPEQLQLAVASFNRQGNSVDRKPLAPRLQELLALAGEGAQRFPEALVGRSTFWAGLPQASPPKGGEDSPDAQLRLYRELALAAQLRAAHGLQVRLRELREPKGVFERRLTAELLDGLLASGSAEREEIRHQLEPLCSSLGLESDEVMMDYVLELAESLGASGAEARLERAAAVLQCIPSAERRARCVVHLL